MTANLQFDWLFNDTEKAAAAKAGPPKTPPEVKRAQQVYKRHQEATQKAEALQTAILQGLKEGQDTAALLLTACECIAAMTGNVTFYRQAEADLLAIYGTGLHHPGPLALQKDAAAARLARLLEAEQRTDRAEDRGRIQRAIKAHKALLEDLDRQP